MLRFATVVALVLMVTGCVLGGDTVFRVQGSLAGRNADSPNCALHLRYVESARSVDFRDIGAAFNAEFVVPAGAEWYFFTAECPDGSRYQSEKIKLGGNSTLGSQVSVGELKPMT